MQTLVSKLATVLLAADAWAGEYVAVVNGQRFPPLRYSVACGLYEVARASGADAAIVGCGRLVRRSWGSQYSEAGVP